MCRSPLQERVLLPDYTPVVLRGSWLCPWPFPLQKRQQVQELASQLPSRIIASVFVGARLAMSLASPALRLAFSKSLPCFRNSLVTHTHTRLHHSFGRCLHKRNDECEPFGVVNRITGVWLCSAANLRRQDDPDPIPEQ